MTKRRAKLFEDERDLARGLRRRSTEAERKLWSRLRDRRHFTVKFRRQVPVGPYVVDFYCHEASLVVEVDGGGHGQRETIGGDAQRTERLEQSGLMVLRFWNTEVMQNLKACFQRSLRLLFAPHPSPLPEGEGTEAISNGSVEKAGSAGYPALSA